ncbi:Nitrogen permease regulator-like 3 [Clonorchis sinensis]|uniref:GATOR complex protein NPRL3 n=1 Tax=Clonorchis sinensis TaxID=79923 RepID=A0A8T1MFH8_CLOSI|nr:Nitrogen permease regulator-like 3 [Clonorchis sinensis]
MISFAVVFSMNEAASPSVLSYYTELARLIASQIRRAELISDYLTRQRDLIVSLMDRSSPGFCPTSNYAHIEPTCPDTVASDPREQPLRRPQKLGSLVETNSSAPGGPTDWKRIGQTSENNKTDGIIEDNRVCRQSVTSMNSPFDQLVAMSSLRNELKTIIDSVCLSGHVSVMINKLYPVFFCLPHKAYSLAPKHAGGPIPAIRPAAVWRAMDKIRPYHTLLLLPRKQDLLQKQLPQEINEAMVEFINDLSPSVSLSELALRTHSQMHCLTLALWLIYQGHAIIVYPIVANNTYVLSPHYATWFSAHLVAQFATMFPTVNLAKVHVYVFLTLIPETLKNVQVSDAVHQTNGSTPNEHFRCAQETPLNSDALISANDLPPGPTCTSFPTISQQESHQCKLPQDVLSKLYKLFPTDFHEAVVETLLKHPGATQNIALLQLFVLILPHLPAHLEELMFHLGVSRATLIECVERFSPILCTVRLPDPVTACFSGVDWPD